MKHSTLNFSLCVIAFPMLLWAQQNSDNYDAQTDDQIAIDLYTRFENEFYDSSCDYIDNCCESLFWVDAEYLCWQINESPRVIPLVFTGIYDASVTPTLQTAGTTIVLGNRTNHEHGRSGLKISAGYDFCFENLYGTDLSYFALGKSTYKKSVQSNDYVDSKVTEDMFPTNSYLAIPYLNATTGQESSVYIAKPGTFAGKATLKIENWMQGAEWNFSTMLDVCCWNIKTRGFIGFRWWNFNDKLTFTTHSPNTTTADIFTTVDEFKTNNNFYGGQFGFDVEYACNGFSCNANIKVALGGINGQLTVDGNLYSNDFDNFGAVQDFSGGYFAQPTNMGQFDKTRFGCIPEVNINLAYLWNDCSRIKIGYSFLYVNRVLWAENQLERNINPTQSVAIQRSSSATLSGKSAPKTKLKMKDLWVQGFNVGIDFNF